MDEPIFEFGSRSGTWLAIILFAVVFGVLGWAVARQVKSRLHSSSAVARAIGLSLFIGPLSVTYWSSFGGFYEAEITTQDLRLHYLFTESRIPLAAIVNVKATPWYRGRWRLVIDTRTGSRHSSATWRRVPIKDSATRLNAMLRRP